MYIAPLEFFAILKFHFLKKQKSLNGKRDFLNFEDIKKSKS